MGIQGQHQDRLIDFEKLPKVVAIVGSRSFPKPAWVHAAVLRLKPKTIVVSGGAQGVDTYAKNATDVRTDLHYKGFNVEGFEWEILGRGAGHYRNEIIIRYLKRYGGHMLIFATESEFEAEKGGAFNDYELCESYEVPYTLIKA